VKVSALTLVRNGTLLDLPFIESIRSALYTAHIVRLYIGTFAIRDAMSFAVFDGFPTRGPAAPAADAGSAP
jgi:hypothetical protein